MRRNMDLIRSILEALESAPAPKCDKADIVREVEGVEAVIKYHITLCEQAGFVRFVAHGVQMTWAGHNELERMRGPS